MADEKKPDDASEPEVKTIRLQHETSNASYTLTIGRKRYAVADGVVEVAEAHYEAAYQSGFRPA
jgi:hypothetical protein